MRCPFIDDRHYGHRYMSVTFLRYTTCAIYETRHVTDLPMLSGEPASLSGKVLCAHEHNTSPLSLAKDMTLFAVSPITDLDYIPITPGHSNDNKSSTFAICCE
jgi:hypothetical protein